MRSLLLAAFFVTACGGAAATTPSIPGTLEPKGKVVLTADGLKVTDDMIETITRGFPKAQLDRMKQSGQYKDFLEQVGMGQVLYKRAIDQKLHEDSTVQMALALAMRDALAKEVIGRVGEDSVSDEKLKEAYEARKVQYATPQVKGRHILVDDEADATQIMTDLKGGADFAATAKEKSKDKASGAKGGDLDWFKKGQMVAEFSEAAFASTGDELIGPVKSKFGYHIIQVTDRRDTIPLEEVKDSLEGTVKQEAVRKFLDEVKGEVKIEWLDETLAKPPEGAAPGGHAPGDGHGH